MATLPGGALTLIELFGTALILLLMLAAAVRGRPMTRIAVVAVVFGIVFANPFGVVAQQSSMDPRPLGPTAKADNARHWVEVAGVPVAWFTPYSEKVVLAGENAHREKLKLRYGFSFLPSIGVTSVVGQCSNAVTDPCWRDDYPLVQQDSNGKTWIVPLSRAPLVDGHGEVEYVHIPHFYGVGLGLASPAGLVYWLIVVGLLANGAMRARLRWRRLAVAVPAAVAVGAAISIVVTVMPGQARSADSVVPQLLPKVAADPDLPDTEVVTPTVLSDEQYDPGCVTHDDGTTSYRCDRADRIAAVPSRDGLLVFWTSQAQLPPAVELRVRDISLSGEPLGVSKRLIAPWPPTHPDHPGYVNCERPASLQAAPIGGGDVLVAWSNSCLIHSRHEPAEITGLVVSSAGEVVKGPFVLARFSLPPAAANASNPPFWLRSTSTGQPLLVWRAKSPTTDYSQMTYAAFLTPSLQVDDAVPIAGSQEGGTARIGSVGVACGETCLIAHSLDGAIELTLLARDGASTEQRIERNAAMLHSELAVAASGDLFFVGWLESELGATANAHIATVQAGHAATVTTVAENTPTGEDAPTVPQPVGILLERGLPSLAWLTKPGADRHESMLLYVAGPHGMTVRRVDAWLLDAMMPLPSAPTIIGVGWIEGLAADPLSARFA